MKKMMAVLLALSLSMGLAGCGAKGTSGSGAGESAAADSGKGKVVIISSTVSSNEEEYRIADQMVEKFPGRVTHVTWPENYSTEQEQMISVVTKVASDPDVKAIVFIPGFPGTNAAIDKLKELRGDEILLLVAGMGENPPDVAKRVDFGMMPNELELGHLTVEEAQKMGADTFLYYSFPRFLSDPIMIRKRDDMKATSEKLGMTFVELTAPDPAGDAGVSGMQQFMFEDIPKQIEKYGENTCIWGAQCGMQVPIIKTVMEKHAIMSLQCCPSPLHGYPTALGLELSDDQKGDVSYIIEQTKEKLKEAGCAGRFATWPVPNSMMATAACTNYAIKWIDGEITERSDVTALKKCMEEYAGVEITLAPYTENGETYDKIQLITMPFLEY